MERISKRQLIVALGLLSFTSLAAAQGVCPGIGQDTTCGTIITITDKGATISNTGQGPYDGVEDTLVGVVNNSSVPIYALGLSGPGIYSFDGDGIDSYGATGNIQDSTGYGGPNAYFTNIALGSVGPDTGITNFINPIPAHGGVGYFSLEGTIGNATACTSLINNSITGPVVKGQGIAAIFSPNYNYSLADAAAVCGFSGFDWQQTITSWPKPSPLFQIGNPVALSAPPPFLDPPPSGYTYEPGGDNSFPFYYDPNSGELKSNETTTELSFFDAPADPCLAGGSGKLCGGKTAPPGEVLAFTTHLVGINLLDGSAVDLGIGFSWTSDFNGTSGGTAVTKSNGPVDPGSGTGGVTIVNVQQTSNYGGLAVTSVNGAPIGQPNTLTSGETCNGVFTGTFVGNVTVTAGQSCTFVNGKITGNVQQYGGTLVLSDSLIGGDVQINGGGTFASSSYTEIDGNLQVQNLPASGATNQICDTTVSNNMQIQNNDASVQIGSQNPAACGGDVVVGNMEIHNNAGSSTVVNNTVSGNLNDHNNVGSTQVSGNSVANVLQCHSNSTITGGGNSAMQKQGQCKGL